MTGLFQQSFARANGGNQDDFFQMAMGNIESNRRKALEDTGMTAVDRLGAMMPGAVQGFQQEGGLFDSNAFSQFEGWRSPTNALGLLGSGGDTATSSNPLETLGVLSLFGGAGLGALRSLLGQSGASLAATPTGSTTPTNTTTPTGASGGRSRRLFDAIVGQESGGDHRVVNKDSGAIGIAQVMPGNISQWTQEALGHSLTPEQFREDKNAQIRTVEHKLEQYWNQAIKDSGGDEDTAIRRVASAWYSGRPGLYDSTRPQGGYPSIRAYTQSILRRYRSGS